MKNPSPSLRRRGRPESVCSLWGRRSSRPSPGRPHRLRRLPVPTAGLALVAALAASLAFAPPAAAELAILDNGNHFKVTAYQVSEDGSRIRLTLAHGGRVTLPLERIERLIDDEWVPPPPAPPEPEAPALAVISWRFQEAAPIPSVPYGSAIYETAKRHGVNPDLVAAVVRAESAFDPKARSHVGARGLMQLMPATGRRFGVQEHQFYDPATNLEAGVRYLAWLLDRFDGDIPLALAGYNAGEGTVDRYAGVPPYRETRNYIQKIYGFLGMPQELLASVL